MTWKESIIAQREPGETSMDRGLTFKLENQRDSGRSWASTASHCPRKDVWGQHAKGGHTDPTSELYYAIGTAVEGVIAKGWNNDGTLLFHGFRLPPLPINVGGEVDAIALIDGTVWAYEIKTCGALPSKPKAAHYSQAMFYSAITGFPARIIYQSRQVASYSGGSPEIVRVEFELPFTQKEHYRVIKNAALAHVYGQRKVSPPMPEKMRKTVDCQYCPFFDVCWNGDPIPLPNPRVEWSDKLEDEAEALAQEIMGNMVNRRHGILKFLSNNGTNHAARLLNGQDWDGIIRDPD